MFSERMTTILTEDIIQLSVLRRSRELFAWIRDGETPERGVKRQLPDIIRRTGNFKASKATVTSLWMLAV